MSPDARVGQERLVAWGCERSRRVEIVGYAVDFEYCSRHLFPLHLEQLGQLIDQKQDCSPRRLTPAAGCGAGPVPLLIRGRSPYRIVPCGCDACPFCLLARAWAAAATWRSLMVRLSDLASCGALGGIVNRCRAGGALVLLGLLSSYYAVCIVQSTAAAVCHGRQRLIDCGTCREVSRNAHVHTVPELSRVSRGTRRALELSGLT